MEKNCTNCIHEHVCRVGHQIGGACEDWKSVRTLEVDVGDEWEPFDCEHCPFGYYEGEEMGKEWAGDFGYVCGLSNDKDWCALKEGRL